MDDTFKRARELLPAIIITVLSMIQALALELFWSRLQDADFLWTGDSVALIGWLQFALMLLGIIEIWLLYVSVMLRFSWIPSMADTTVPFAIGLLEFAMIDLIGPATLGPWFFILGVLFGLVMFTTRVMLRKARRDGSNAWFFRGFAPYHWRDHAYDILVVLLLLALGGLLWWLEARTWLSIGCLCLGLVIMTQQLVVTHRYWLPFREPAGPDSNA